MSNRGFELGLIDRLKSLASTRVGDPRLSSQAAEQEAMRLLDGGLENEKAGRLQEALENYDAAIRLKPDFGRCHFNRGNVLLELGNLQDALDAYANALTYKPDSAAAYFNSGNAHARLGQREASIAAYRQALALRPEFADAEVAMGVVSQELKCLDDAIACFRRALAIEPDYAEVYYNLGGALAEQGKLDEAVSNFRRSLELKPNYWEAHLKLGIALADLGQFEAAAASYTAALKIRPDSIEAYNNLATALIVRGEHEAAVEGYRQALIFAPDRAEIHNNLGVALKSLGKLEDATASYRRALAINPKFAEAHSNLATALHKLGRTEEALNSYNLALEIDPDNADVHNNLGVLQNQLGQLERAVESYCRALEKKPDYVDSLSNLGSVQSDLGRLDAALGSYRRALEINPDYNLARSNLLFIQNYLVDHSSSELLAEARCFGEAAARQARPYTTWSNIPTPTRTLRIGFVSADLRQHPVGYFAENVLTALAHIAEEHLELFAYSNSTQVDATTARIKACCAGWHEVYSLSDEHLARLVRNDGIDILIDLSGHTGENRLPMFAWKPAPIQVSWLGYFATTGVAAIDYLIADPWTLPESEESNFTETIWRLPETRLCFTPPAEAPDVGPLPALSNCQVTFGCLNNLTKINDQVVALWARILMATPSSLLLLKARSLGEVSVQQNVRSRFADHGVAPQRLILEQYVPRGDYLATYNSVDIALDPFPFPGGTTTAEALWMGVPVLTLAGRQFLARQGVGLLMNAGLPEWVASDQDDYLSRAVAHASDLQRLASLRAGLRQQVLASPIFDAPRFARHFEAALRGMWEKWCHEQGAAF
jgi:protein O-GlcNAc transferase